MRLKKAVFIAQLPPTPCTLEMRESFIHAALGLGKSMAEAQREAVALFLAKNDTKAINNDAESISDLVSKEGQG